MLDLSLTKEQEELNKSVTQIHEVMQAEPVPGLRYPNGKPEKNRQEEAHTKAAYGRV